MPAITTLGGLKAACADALVRGDFDARIAAATPLAEAWLNRNLRLRAMQSDEALTTAAGEARLALPSGCLEPLSLTLNDGLGAWPIPMRAADGATGAGAGRPGAYSLEGASLVFDRPCDAAYSLTLRMLKRFALDGDDDSNALLDAWPDLYLAALLVAVTGVHLTDDPRLAAWKVSRDELLAEVNRQEARASSPARLQADASLRGRWGIDYAVV